MSFGLRMRSRTAPATGVSDAQVSAIPGRSRGRRLRDARRRGFIRHHKVRLCSSHRSMHSRHLRTGGQNESPARQCPVRSQGKGPRVRSIKPMAIMPAKLMRSTASKEILMVAHPEIFSALLTLCNPRCLSGSERTSSSSSGIQACSHRYRKRLLAF